MKRYLAVASLLLVMMLVVPVAASASGYISGENQGAGPVFNRAIVLAMRITMRDQPSFQGKTVTRIAGGSEVTMLSEANGWVQATYTDDKGNTYTGWLREIYLAKNPVVLTLRQSGVAALAAPSSNSKHVGDLPKYTVLPVIGTWGEYYIVSLRNAAAYVHVSVKAWTDTELAAYFQQPGFSATVVNKSMLRTGPGTDWDKVEELKAGATVEVLSYVSENGWLAIRYKDEFIAYISEADIQAI